ncbi:diacylglycerol/lipid kinase family protein [Pseudomonas putida]|uniref:diacylglycerol/lipid kinase family protein n=1 Tax=Pseudomonas putida TaxID=303 RepID=UPI0039059B8C
MTSHAPLPRRIGVLLNPLSGRGRRNLPRFYLLLQQLPGASITEVRTPEEIDQAIAQWQLTEDDMLLVVGGDGTLQAALTSLLRRADASLPKVQVAPAGTTNMSANAIGVRGNPCKSVKALVHWLQRGGTAPLLRPTAVLQVLDNHTGHVQCGMFFGAGAIVAGVRYFHERVRPTGLQGVLGPLTAFARMLLALFSRNSQRLLPTVNARIQFNGRDREAPWLVLLATTLDKLLLGSTPFWGAEPAPLRLTAIAKTPAQLCWSLPAVLRARPNAAMRTDLGYLSHNVDAVRLEQLREYLLDGEIFTASGPLALTASRPVQFIIP